MLHDLPPHLGRSRERDLVHVGMAHQRRAGGRSAARHDVERARRQSGFEHQLGHRQRGQRCFRRRLEDDGAARGERRGELPARDVEREVPRDDGAHHTHGLPRGIAEEGTIDGQRIAGDLVRPPAVVAQRVDGHRELDLRLEQRLAVVRRFEPSELVQPGLEQVGRLGQHAAALPRREGRARRRNRSTRAPRPPRCRCRRRRPGPLRRSLPRWPGSRPETACRTRRGATRC